MDAARLRIALQKSGRLSQDSLALLAACGIHVSINKARLFYHCDNFPLDILLVRDDDIPNLVAEHVCDFGIVGENVLVESGLAHQKDPAVEVMDHLGFGHCHLAIALPKNLDYQGTDSLASKTIATSYPRLLKRFLDQKGVSAKIVELSGSVEVAPSLGLADAICDLVSTGATLEGNGLRAVAKVLDSQALLIKTKQVLGTEKLAVADLMQKRMRSVQQAKEAKYIMLHAPKDQLDNIIQWLPGVATPTILPLAGMDDLVAVHAVSKEALFWDTLEQLKAAGASSILVLPIEKMLG